MCFYYTRAGDFDRAFRACARVYNVVMVRVERVSGSGKAVRAGAAAAVADSPAAETGFRPAPDRMTFREAAWHILDAGDGLIGLMLAGAR